MKDTLQHIPANLGDKIGNFGKVIWRKLSPDKQPHGALPWDGYAWGVDLWGGVGEGSSHAIPLQEWVDNGCAFIICKMGDGHQIVAGDAYDPTNYVDRGFGDFCQQAYDVKNKQGSLGIPFFGYYFFRGDLYQEPDPNKPTADFQFRIIQAAMKSKTPGKSVQGIFLDFEQKDDTQGNASKELRQLFAWISNWAPFDPMYRGIYTSMGMLGWATDAAVWIGKAGEVDPYWGAQWIYAANIKIDGWLNLFKYFPSATAKLKTPGMMTTWRFWQILGDVVGLYKNGLDINLFHGDVKAFLEYAVAGGYSPRPSTTPPPEPDPDDPPVPADLTALTARVVSAEDAIKDLQATRTKVRAA